MADMRLCTTLPTPGRIWHPSLRCHCNRPLYRNTAREFGIDASQNVLCSWCFRRVANEDGVGWCPNSGKDEGHGRDIVLSCSACLYRHRVRRLILG